MKWERVHLDYDSFSHYSVFPFLTKQRVLSDSESLASRNEKEESEIFHEAKCIREAYCLQYLSFH